MVRYELVEDIVGRANVKLGQATPAVNWVGTWWRGGISIVENM